MVVKLASKKIPLGLSPREFRYVGRTAGEQGDFGPEVGIVDMVPVNDRGITQESRYFHMGVVEARGQWFVYMETGPVANGRSWIGDSPQSNLMFMFTRCRDQKEAHRFFRRQCMTMNFGRITRKCSDGKPIWAAKTNANGEAEPAWLVCEPSNPDRGLPQVEPERVEASVVPVVEWQPHEPVRAELLIRGVLHDAKLASHSRGVVPTLEALEQIGQELLPMVMRRIAELSAPNRGLMIGAMSERARANSAMAAN
jgi:hypothetical protein